MTKREHERLAHQRATLQALGFTEGEADQLRRISMTLQRWHELECGGYIERDDATGKPYWLNAASNQRYLVSDRERGAKKRLKTIINARNARESYHDIATMPSTQTIAEYTSARNLAAYIQTDPRGAALYLLRPGDIPKGESVESCYTRGICVY